MNRDMANYFLNYGVVKNSEKGNMLIISCYHNTIDSMALFRSLVKEKNKGTSPSLQPILKQGLIPSSMEECKNAIVTQLKEILKEINIKIDEIVFSGDANLGSAGREQFPPFLFNGTVDAVLTENALFKSAKVEIILESSDEQVVKAAKKINQDVYVAEHEKHNSDSPVVIRRKQSKSLLLQNSVSPTGECGDKDKKLRSISILKEQFSNFKLDEEELNDENKPENTCGL